MSISLRDSWLRAMPPPSLESIEWVNEPNVPAPNADVTMDDVNAIARNLCGPGPVPRTIELGNGTVTFGSGSSIEMSSGQIIIRNCHFEAHDELATLTAAEAARVNALADNEWF